jgi:predicted nuclease of predicted toxin-antitoxin system
MRFLVDAQLPPALARWIATQPGHTADHVADVLAATERDTTIVSHAVANNAVIVTKDADFLNLAPPPPLRIVATGNMPNKALLAVFENQFTAAVAKLVDGSLVVEIGALRAA